MEEEGKVLAHYCFPTTKNTEKLFKNETPKIIWTKMLYETSSI